MIELTTSVFLLFSAFYGTASASAKPVEPVVPMVETASAEDPAIVDGVALMALTGKTGINVEADVRAYFKDTPLLAEIARCESRFRHLGDNGEILRGKVNKSDVGVMQINKYYHDDEALKLGFNLNTLQGNMAFAQWLYDKKGSAPWQSSSGCWQKYVPIAKK